jgi:hypothetical protein
VESLRGITSKGISRQRGATSGQNRPKNANDPEQHGARTSGASELFEVVPAPELLSIDVAVENKIGTINASRKGQSTW